VAAICFTNVTFAIETDSSDGVLRKAAARYRGIILVQSAGLHVAAVPGRGQAYEVALVVENSSVPLSPGDMSERYELDASAAGCTISAHSVWGALRGLETLAQLVKPLAAGFQLDVPIMITDAP
jgi:hexosaminidase